MNKKLSYFISGACLIILASSLAVASPNLESCNQNGMIDRIIKVQSPFHLAEIEIEKNNGQRETIKSKYYFSTLNGEIVSINNPSNNIKITVEMNNKIEHLQARKLAKHENVKICAYGIVQ